MILVTGITGLVGSFVAKQLLDAGYKVRGLVRPAANKNLLSEDYISKIDWHYGDILDIGSLTDASVDVETIIHCAAIISFAPKGVKNMYNVNVIGTANIVNVAVASNINRLIHVSSIAALGRKVGTTIIDEQSKWETSPNNSNYAKTKYLAELEIWRGMEEGLTVSIINPSIILGPGHTNKGSTKLFEYAAKENIFYTKGNINYVDVRDVATAIVKLLSYNGSLKQFVISGGCTTYRTFFEKIAKFLCKKPAYIQSPKLILEIAWRAVAVYSWVFNKEPLLTKETSRTAKNGYIYNATKSIEELGMDYHSLDQSIAFTCHKLYHI